MKRLSCILWILAIGMTVVLLAANLWFGELNQDEGWYLYAARSIAAGRFPFLDFATTQGPVLPFVYVLAMPLVDRLGVLGARLFTVLLALAGAGAAAGLAGRLAGKERCRTAAFLAFVLVGVNVYQAYFCAIVKTYALGSLFLLLGFLLLTVPGRRGTASLLGGVLMALATGTRSSAVFVIPLVFLVLLASRARFRGRAPGPEAHGRPWAFLAGAVLGGAAVFLPFWLGAPRAFWYGMVEYHAAREAGSVTQMLAYKAGFLSRSVFAYFPAVALLVVLVVCRLSAGPGLCSGLNPETRHRKPLCLTLWLSAGAVTLVHFLAPFPYDDYQVMIYPLFAVALAVELTRSVLPVRTRDEAAGQETPRSSSSREVPASGGRAPAGAICSVVLLVCAAAAFSSPRNQAWVIGERDRIWWPLRQETSLQGLRRAADTVRELADRSGAGVLLTQDTYLAVESGLRVPSGLEMGPFSYCPGFDRERAEACHVVNRDMMLGLLRSGDAPVAAFSEYGLAIEAPAVRALSSSERSALTNALLAAYERYGNPVKGFGQAATELRIYVRRRDRPPRPE